MLISKRFENNGRSRRFPLHFCVLTDQSNSSARLFFGKGAVMAKALGTTPEEEHRLGLSKLAAVRLLIFFFSDQITLFNPANKRTSWAIFHRYKTPRSDRLVCRLPATRFCSRRKHGDTHCGSTCRTDHETLFGPARAFPS